MKKNLLTFETINSDIIKQTSFESLITFLFYVNRGFGIIISRWRSMTFVPVCPMKI